MLEPTPFLLHLPSIHLYTRLQHDQTTYCLKQKCSVFSNDIMTDTAGISSTSSSSSSYTPSPQPSSAGGRASSLSQHRPPPLKIDTESPIRPQSQPVMAASGRGENSGHNAVVSARPLLLPTPGSSSYPHHDEDGGPKNKKRAKPIDIDEANQSNIARLSLHTPTTARSDGPQELICLCAKAPKVPRPRNGMYFSPHLSNWHWPCFSRPTPSPRDLVLRCHCLSTLFSFSSLSIFRLPPFS